MPASASRVETRRVAARVGLEKISVAKLPVTGSDIFGREEDIAFLDRAWANKGINVVTIISFRQARVVVGLCSRSTTG